MTIPSTILSIDKSSLLQGADDFGEADDVLAAYRAVNPPGPGLKPMDASLLRRIRDAAFKVLDIIVSGFSFFGKVDTLYNYNDMNLVRFRELMLTRCLGKEVVSEYGRFFASKHNDFEFLPDLMFGSSFSKPLNQKNYIAIPVVLEGSFQNHTVLFFVDTLNKRIEYYDSKGLTIKDRNDPRLKAALDRVIERYGKEDFTLIENREKHQYDSHNSGVYVMDYFYRRMKGESPDAISASGPGPCAANQELRARMIVQLAQNRL